MSHRAAILLLALGCAATAGGAVAQQRVVVPREATPAPFARALQCRAVTDPGERLACYDREVQALESAAATNQIRVIDRQQVQRTRRTLFGLTLPDLDIFGDDDGAGVSEINATIRAVSVNPLGRYTFTLDDGARWIQIDSRELNEPRVGQPIRIRRAAMGSYLANVNRQVAIRVRRAN